MRLSNLAPPYPDHDFPPTKRDIDMAERARMVSLALRLISERGFEITLTDPIGQRYHDWFRARQAWFTDPLDWDAFLAVQIYGPRPVGYGEPGEIAIQLTDYVREHFWTKKRAMVESWYTRRALVDPAYGTLDIDTALDHFAHAVLERSRQYLALLEDGL